MTRMRVAIVSAAYPPHGTGGIATQAHAKATGLAAHGHEVTVIVRGDRAVTRADGDVQVVTVPGVDARLPVDTDAVRWLTDSVEVAAAIESLHRRQGLDLVDVAEWGGEGFVHLLNMPTIPTVVQIHGPLPMLQRTIGWPAAGDDLDRVGRLMEATCLRNADAVYTSSRLSARWCSTAYGIDLTEAPVWHCGVDSRRFHPDAAVRSPQPTVVFVGRLAQSKGVDELVDACLEVAAAVPDLRLVLVGRTEPSFDVAARQRRCVDAGRPHLLDIRGPLQHDELPRTLAAADVFAAPSWYEGGPGLVYLEAMAAGLPVIATAATGVAEVVDDGRTGILVRPRDPAGLAVVLRALLADPDRRAQLGTAARAYVEAHADRRGQIRWLETYYSDVIRRGRDRRAA